MKSLILAIAFLSLSFASVSKAETSCWMSAIVDNKPAMLIVDPEVVSGRTILHFTLGGVEFGQVTVSDVKNQLDEIVLYPEGLSEGSEVSNYVRIPLKGLNFQRGKVNKLTVISELILKPTDPNLDYLKDVKANITCKKL